MAKKSCIQKTKKKKSLIEKYAKKRAELKDKMSNPSLDLEERMVLQEKLENLPLNSAKIRHRNRCCLLAVRVVITGILEYVVTLSERWPTKV